MTSLATQRQAVEHCLALLESLEPGEHTAIIENARKGCLSLGWFERRSELVRQIVNLDKRAPGLAQILQEFPDARMEVRHADTDAD